MNKKNDRLNLQYLNADSKEERRRLREKNRERGDKEANEKQD